MPQALLDPYHHISLLPFLSLSLFLWHTLLPCLRIIVFTLCLYCHPHHSCSFFLNLLLMFSFALSVLLISLAISIISLFLASSHVTFIITLLYYCVYPSNSAKQTRSCHGMSQASCYREASSSPRHWFRDRQDIEVTNLGSALEQSDIIIQNVGG